MIVVLLLLAAAISYQFRHAAPVPIPATGAIPAPVKTSAQPATIVPAKPEAQTAQQQMADIVDCTALLAVHTSRTRGELKADSPVMDLISYSLGKARELAQQSGLPLSAAKTLYDQKTVAYFLAYAANPAAAISQNQGRATACEKQLQEYEPNAQIQTTINKARAMAREKQ